MGRLEGLPPGCLEVASILTCSFSFTAAAQSFTVPAGVSSITAAAFGAQGGGSGGAGGLGGEAQAVFAVSPEAAVEVWSAARAGPLLARRRALPGGSTVAALAAMAVPARFLASGAGRGGSGGGGASDVRTGRAQAR